MNVASAGAVARQPRSLVVVLPPRASHPVPVASGTMSDSTTTDPRPAALDAARHTAQAVQDVGAKFMLDMDMYGEVAGLGYQGLGFYIAGRGGVLGDVEHVEVFEAMTFFPAETRRRAGSRPPRSRAWGRLRRSLRRLRGAAGARTTSPR